MREPRRLDEETGRRLLAVAREAIRKHLAGESAAAPDPAQPLQAAFVTLRQRADGALRGCIGQVEARDPLEGAVAKAAVLAATRDPRFAPVSSEELATLRLEVSVLSPFAPSSPEAVEPGLHGVLVTWSGGRGLLLPQVAVEQGWDRETLLDHACLKAGAPAGAWRDGSAEIRTFTAEVAGEP